MARRRTRRNDHRIRRGDRRVRLLPIERDEEFHVPDGLMAKLLLAYVGFQLYKWWTTPAAAPKS